ncbi:MAG TPA: PQQ-dependent sugar dehydrogenase, partial [Burkholderiaceae bacterium]|nr:PQQ-dependent sugar dehydrogenase [Burkholderiaceae bacterium]
GWPLVSYAVNYDGVPIPSPDTRADLAKPAIYWTPVIAPGNMVLYEGAPFPQWNASLLIGGLGSESLSRVVFDARGNPAPAERWRVGFRVRDVAVAPDGTVWLLEDSSSGALLRLTPK